MKRLVVKGKITDERRMTHRLKPLKSNTYECTDTCMDANYVVWASVRKNGQLKNE